MRSIKLYAFYGLDKCDENIADRGLNDRLIDGWMDGINIFETLSCPFWKVSYV